ncbi:MFS transporter [Rathayibacter sp. KR2-224]|uniref:MFS transporter n=1 Tax=Rathayibacter sp. KR2-224 TaxID=3400913 RepID=UPI003C0BB0F4
MYDTYRYSSPGAAAPELRRARVAVCLVFATTGFLVGMWSGSIPLVARGAGLSVGGLGVVILVSSVGIVAGANVGGRLQARTGSIPLCIAGLGTASFGLVAMGVSGDAIVLTCAITIMNFGMGLNDVGMNMQAVWVERSYGRPIMSAFHAFFSLGGVAGALAVLGTAALRWTVVPQLGMAAVLAAVSVCVAAGWLVRPADETADAGNASDKAVGTASWPASDVVIAPAGWPELAADVAAPVVRVPRIRVRWTRLAWMLGACALLLMFTEGVVTDWSALQLTQAFGAATGVAAFGYGAFSFTMTCGRLVIDRAVAAIGPVAVVRLGALTGAAGILAVMFAPSVWIALAGWALLGIGLCGCVPQVFSSAGNQQHGSVVLSRVLAFGYVGIFGGPALFGLAANATSVTVALLVPLAALACAAVLAGAVRRGPSHVQARSFELPEPSAQ